MPKISGGCLCRAVTYSCSEPAALTVTCHCTHCQKQSGSAFSINVAVPKAALTITSGKPAVYEDKGDSGLPVYRHFCRDCGSPLFSDVAAMPLLSVLKAGTLDDTSWVKPEMDLWCKSAQPWTPHPKGCPSSPKTLRWPKAGGLSA
jgi:hypothetical protein